MAENNLAGFIWSVADILRGDYKQSMYGRVILPFTVLRRLDCVLEDTKDMVLAEYARIKDMGIDIEPVLTRKTGKKFYNISSLNFERLLDDPQNIESNFKYMESELSSRYYVAEATTWIVGGILVVSRFLGITLDQQLPILNVTPNNGHHYVKANVTGPFPARLIEMVRAVWPDRCSEFHASEIKAS